jgi:PKD repeat protein
VLHDYTGIPPTAAFDFYEDDPADPRAIQFLDRSFGEREIVSSVWDFGDRTTSTEPFPMHHYATSGPKTVTLTVTDDAGNTDSETRVVEVGEPAPGV